jgi:hypothetical protein
MASDKAFDWTANLSDQVKSKIDKYTNRALTFATRSNINLARLSPKKRTALSCIAAAMDRVVSIDQNLKNSWFNWIYYMMKMIDDSEVDKLALAIQETSTDYTMTYFSNEFIESVSDENKQAARILMKPYHKNLADKNLKLQEDFKQFLID